MKSLVVCLIGLLAFVEVDAEQQPTVSGQVRLSGSLPVAGAQVMLFDLADLRRGAVAQATTDEFGAFALPLASLGGAFALPQGFALGYNYPNPFNPSTIIPYQLPTTAYVRLEVFNMLGQRIATLVDGDQSAGLHTAVWNATNGDGQAVAAGVYLYRLVGAGMEFTRRMVLVDGQAGTAAAVPPAAMPSSTTAAERTYGLVISGAGVATYVDAAFRVQVGMAPVEFVVEPERLPRGKALTYGILGDVNNDGQVDVEDALLVLRYSLDTSIMVPNNGDMSLGDVNNDGQVDVEDALAIMEYVANPSKTPAEPKPETTEPLRRLPNSESDRFPAWSPDGQKIAFSSYREDGDGDLYVLDADGSNLSRLTNADRFDGHPAWSPDGQKIVFSSYRDGNYELYVLDADGSNLSRLTNYNGNDLHPAWSPDGQHIAFAASGRDGSLDIYVMDVDGNNVRQLTNDDRDNRSPAWSPDGRQIAFSSGNQGSSIRDIYVMDADGSNVRQLTNDGGQYPAWSPDGQRIAFISERDGNEKIYVIDVGDSNPSDARTPLEGIGLGMTCGNRVVGPIHRLTNNRISDKHPAWSPDGQKIAFVSFRGFNRDIYVMDADSSNVRQLTNDAGEETDPVWSPDGQKIAFVSGGSIYVMDADGQNRQQLRSGSDPSWLPDGQHIVFVSSSGGDVYVMDADGQNERRLIGHDVAIRHPVWSPDGHQIAYEYRKQIYVRDIDGENGRRLTDGNGGVSPVWSPDGHQIAFMSERDGDAEIYVMDADGENLRQLTDNSESDLHPAWSPDGHQIAFMSERDGDAEIYVMDIDGENLRQLTDNIRYDDQPVWSSDSQHIAFVSKRHGNREIYMMSTDGSNVRRLTNNLASDDQPTWAPGRHIIFMSNNSMYIIEPQLVGCK